MDDLEDGSVAPQEHLAILGAGGEARVDAESGRTVLEFVARPELVHNGGVVQGGFVTGWIDAAMAMAVTARTGAASWPATLEVKVSFLRPVLPGARVRAEGWIEREGRSIVFLAGRLLGTEGELLATASSTAKLLPTARRPGG